MSIGSDLLALLEAAAQLLKIAQISLTDIGGDLVGCAAVVSVTGEVAVLDHQHPGLTIAQQFQAKCLAQGVARAEQVAQSISGQFKGGFKGFDQALLFAVVERWWLKEGIKLRQGLLIIGKTQLPADVSVWAGCDHRY